jgi:hypothetical protein
MGGEGPAVVGAAARRRETLLGPNENARPECDGHQDEEKHPGDCAQPEHERRGRSAIARIARFRPLRRRIGWRDARARPRLGRARTERLLTGGVSRPELSGTPGRLLCVRPLEGWACSGEQRQPGKHAQPASDGGFGSPQPQCEPPTSLSARLPFAPLSKELSCPPRNLSRSAQVTVAQITTALTSSCPETSRSRGQRRSNSSG